MPLQRRILLRLIAKEVAALCAQTVPDCAEVEEVLQFLGRACVVLLATVLTIKPNLHTQASHPGDRDEHLYRGVAQLQGQSMSGVHTGLVALPGAAF